MRRLLLCLLMLVVAGASPLSSLTAASFATSTASAAVRPVRAPEPRTPKRLPAAIEPLAPYVEDTACDLRVRRGTRELATMLARTYHAYDGSSWASTYTCGTDGTRSEHDDGRAIDWMVDVSDPRAHAAAKAFLSWLLATDPAGNRFAMARRLGLMYVIYDNRMWGAWDGRWEDYDNCQHLPKPQYANSCHRTHLHISLSWNGAMGRTSFWTHRVPATEDYGPCVRAGLAWAAPYRHRNPTPCRRAAGPQLPKHASATARNLAAYSGIVMHRGGSGPAVSAVQAALGVPQTGTFDLATLHAMWRFQQRHHLARTRVLRQPTWLALLAATR